MDFLCCCLNEASCLMLEFKQYAPLQRSAVISPIIMYATLKGCSLLHNLICKKVFTLWLHKVAYLAFRKKKILPYIIYSTARHLSNIKDQAISVSICLAINFECVGLEVKDHGTKVLFELYRRELNVFPNGKGLLRSNWSTSQEFSRINFNFCTTPF